jgi:hypothetical protein
MKNLKILSIVSIQLVFGFKCVIDQTGQQGTAFGEISEGNIS